MNDDDVIDIESTSKTANKCIEILRSLDIQVVVFDMDQTAVAMHSRGRLRRDRLSEYLEKATPVFLQLVPALHAAGFQLAIATHSDEAEFYARQQQEERGVQPETHILGRELVMALLQRYFPDNISQDFCVVAYNPRVRPSAVAITSGMNNGGNDNQIKRYHMRQIIKHFQVEEPQKILFFDDTKDVVEDCNETCGVTAIKVDPETGLQWSDLLQLEKNS